ncbi:unnamed protein product [Caenorhabditis brenneri]
MNRSEQLEMMSKEDGYDTFERDNLVAQEEYKIGQENSIKLESRSMKILTSKFGNINSSDTQENLPTFAIPTFDIQEFFFGKTGDLEDTKKNNQEVVDRYLAEHGLPLTTNMTLSNVPTGWVLNHDKDETKDQDEDICYPVAPGFSYSQLLSSFDGFAHNTLDEEFGTANKTARNHPYARNLSEKKKEKKPKCRIELSQSGDDCSKTNGLDADDGCFGGHLTDQ